MKKILTILVLIAIFPAYKIEAQKAMVAASNNTALVMKKGKWETGILQPLRLGLGKQTEIQSQAFLFPLLPNAGLKVGWNQWNDLWISSEHSLSLPSVFLNTVSRKGTAGIISPEFDFPFLLGFNNSLILSKVLPDSSILSLKGGLYTCFNKKSVDPLATIDLPVFYPRMAQYYEGYSIRLMLSYKGNVMKRLVFEESLQLFLNTRMGLPVHSENVGALIWRTGRTLRLKAGYNLSYGNYPFGNHWQLWPFIDLVFGSPIR